MAVTPLKILLFCAGGIAAAAGVAYVSGALDPYLTSQPAEVATLTQPDDPEPQSVEPAEESASPGKEARVPEAEMAETADPPVPARQTDDPGEEAEAPATLPVFAGPVEPTFDVVRVEGDGSLVVAGEAPPNAKVEILSGPTVIASTVAGPDGAFAIVLDNPLEPGDYQLTLRATTAENVLVDSAQTALVSVPEKADGQVLAMVEEPGKPAALMTVPEPAMQIEAPSPAATEEAVPAAETAKPVGETAEAPPEPAAAAPEPAAAGEVAAAPAAAGAEVAPATPAVSEALAQIAVEAVEIDGDKVFVAGRADPGRHVRAYANEILLGDAVTSPDGHFLVEATRPLSVGTYNVRVDALDADGAKVVARASVPFERGPGEAIAAVAPNAPDTPAAVAPPDESTPTAPSGPVVAASDGDAAEAALAAPSDNVPETVSPKLENVDGAVIIRRHDTLWHISRRVYGHGIRYTTIYLANQDQIRDPDLIWPGQVFRVPDKTEEGEPANLDALGEQATTAPLQEE